MSRLVAFTMNRANGQMIRWTVALMEIQPTDRVLEVGFGPGLGIQEAAARATDGLVAGVDYSRDMLKVASRRNARAIAEGRVELKLAEATSIPYEDDTFDKAFAVNVLYFPPDPLPFLEEIERVMAPGGTVAVSVTHPDDMAKLACTRTDVFTTYSADELVGLLGRAGFTDARTEAMNDQSFRNICALGTKRPA